MLFICANPDFDTIENNPDSDKYCMGTIAQLYRNIGGKTFELGKPSSEIYDESIKKINNIDKSRILAIGDSIHHDILGASNFGIDSLLITSTGIHKNLFDVENPKWQNELNYFQNMLIHIYHICINYTYLPYRFTHIGNICIQNMHFFLNLAFRQIVKLLIS